MNANSFFFSCFRSRRGELFLPLVVFLGVAAVDAVWTSGGLASDAVAEGVQTRPIPQDDAWPGWRGRHRDGICGWLPEKLPDRANIIWQQSLGGPGLGGIAATAEYVIIGDRDLMDQSDLFRCYSARDGQPLWTFTYPAFGQLDYGNSPRATPLIGRDRVYFLGAFGDLHAVNLKTGIVAWSRNFRLDFGLEVKMEWGTCGSPLIADGKLIVNPGAPGASVVALDPETGEIVWKSPGSPAAYGSLITAEFSGVKQVIGHDKVSLGGWDLATGKRLWMLKPDEPDDFNVPTPVVVGKRLLVTSENNGTRFYQFDSEGRIVPEPVAVNDDLAADIGTPVVVEDRVFAVWGKLYCLDLKNDLKTVWLGSDKSFRRFGSLIGSKTRLLIAGASGELLLIDAGDGPFRVVSRLRVFDTEHAELYSHPAMVGSRLYLRGENSLVCLELDSP